MNFGWDSLDDKKKTHWGSFGNKEGREWILGEGGPLGAVGQGAPCAPVKTHSPELGQEPRTFSPVGSQFCLSPWHCRGACDCPFPNGRPPGSFLDATLCSMMQPAQDEGSFSSSSQGTQMEEAHWTSLGQVLLPGQISGARVGVCVWGGSCFIDAAASTVTT